MKRRLTRSGLIPVFAMLAFLVMPEAARADVEATVVWYMEQEPGTEQFKVRYIVTPEYLRSDEGGDGEGFVLLDRKEKQIYNVVPGTGTVLEINGDGELPSPPASLSIEVQESIDRNAPRLEGHHALTLELSANGTPCRSAIVVPGLLENVSEALAEFQQVLAVQQARMLGNTPEELKTPCYLANTVFATDYHVGRGIPLMEWRTGALSRELLEYKRGVKMPESLFEMPEDYRRFSPPADQALRR
ncbi:MAG: hypothetical protein RQ736_00210 [Thiogranum sp.]|nr:hypothetical protein [Thiogranum sp.]